MTSGRVSRIGPRVESFGLGNGFEIISSPLPADWLLHGSMLPLPHRTEQFPPTATPHHNWCQQPARRIPTSPRPPGHQHDGHDPKLAMGANPNRSTDAQADWLTSVAGPNRICDFGAASMGGPDGAGKASKWL
ncbi:uncharacterized protein B0I36DRAFT_310976 [Microdochium trichocladiopsis]|uniref:Uncharacterized protein n=1 Tax=Microdochium trichocladiopsis TaxID=1682393 RepID=A0A9P8YID1_9PEZI|nr:uncharacterized protein B0I36DRAFT_310976 [Microdochium trichocladiopsis]KAH7040552.1 hypothetical protein B0I36DRAFT_310976 [Microdochium trichocladiopsis]